MKLGKSILLMSALCGLTGYAQPYSYRWESFEEEAWSEKKSSVTVSTGEWTTNKNIQDSNQARTGSYSLFFSAKNGLVFPELTEGAGTLIYYNYCSNRTVCIEVSYDNAEWIEVESYKETSQWGKHVVPINDSEAKYLRIRTTSNGNFYLDDLILTKPDGTDADGNLLAYGYDLPYFVQDFENRATLPSSKEEVVTPKTIDVPGQGEWIFLNAYKSTNASYIADGSATALRMLKTNSYVVTPVLNQGVVKFSFDEGRTQKAVSVYSSTDEGKSWELVRTFKTESSNTIVLNDRNINRIKLANDQNSGDVDIDNLCVTAFPSGDPAALSKALFADVNASSAVMKSTLLSQGSHPLIEAGFCWSDTDSVPTLDHQTVRASLSNSELSATLVDLPAASTIWARAYALSLAGVAYAPATQFITSQPSAPIVSTLPVVEDELSDEQSVYVMARGSIVDHGGTAIEEVGVCYSLHASFDQDVATVKGVLSGTDFRVALAWLPDTTYYVKAYARNQVGTSYGEMVSYKTRPIVVPDYAHHVYYCHPEGNDQTGDGSLERPFYSLQLAVNKVLPGDTIFMMAGEYHYTQRINIGRCGEPNSGRIALFSKGGRAVLDFSAMELNDSHQGIRMTASYWHVYGLDICGAGDNGMLIERNKPSGGGYAQCVDSTHQAHDNIVEFCSFYRNRDTGLQLKNLASKNYIINCDAYFNCDPDHGDADGFAVKISHGDGNYFYGCRAWNNSDDGWDQFIKKEGGFPDDITTTLEHCWAFQNGYLEDGQVGTGNGNGFKMGSNEGRNNVIMNRCLTFDNLQKGFDQNHNTGHMILNNCTGYSAKDLSNKSHYTYRIDEDVAPEHEIRFTNCVAISDGIADRNKSEYAPYSIKGSLITCDFTTLPADYVSIDKQGTDGPRQADGRLPELAFMRIAEGNTKLIDKGSVVVPYVGESRMAEGIRYEGTAPDLGCFETSPATSIDRPKALVAVGSSELSVVTTRSGLMIVTLERAKATDCFQLTLHSLDGRCQLIRRVNGGTCCLDLPATLPSGPMILTVENNQRAVSTKVLIQ